MDKVAYYKEEIIKLASTAWGRYLKGATGNVEKLRSRAGDLLRESSPRWATPGVEHLEAAKSAIRKGTVTPDVTKYIRKSYNPGYKPGLRSKPISSLNKNELQTRKHLLDGGMSDAPTRHEIKNSYKTSIPEYRKKIYKNHRPEGNQEDYINIVHGGEHSKIKNFINTGNTKNLTENKMATNKLSEPASREGLMFHSKIKDRAADYAHTHSESRLGNPAVLAGRIKKKHLYRNGDSDEYSLPKHLYNKIEDAKIYTPKDKEYGNNDFYSHIKKASHVNNLIEKLAARA